MWASVGEKVSRVFWNVSRLWNKIKTSYNVNRLRSNIFKGLLKCQLASESNLSFKGLFMIDAFGQIQQKILDAYISNWFFCWIFFYICWQMKIFSIFFYICFDISWQTLYLVTHTGWFFYWSHPKSTKCLRMAKSLPKKWKWSNPTVLM